MRQGFIVTINDCVVYESKDSRHPARLRRHIDEIENKLEQGFQLGDDWLDAPNSQQKSQYMAMNLLNAIDSQDAGLIHLFGTFLSIYDKQLKQINAKCIDDVFTFSLKYK